MKAACRCSCSTFAPERGQSDVGRTVGKAQKQGRRWYRVSSFGCTMEVGRCSARALEKTGCV